MYCRKCGDLLKKTGKKFECVRGVVRVHDRTPLRLVRN